MTLYQKLTAFLSKGNRANWCLFLLFTGIIFVKLCLFHYYHYHVILVSSIWKNPTEFWLFYLPKIGISCAMASLVFLFKRKYWIIYISIITDIWAIANLLYFRSYDRLLDIYAITMIGNLNDGYWDSIILFSELKDFIFLGISIFLGLSFILFDNKKAQPLISPIIVLIACCIWFGGEFLIKQVNIFGSYEYVEPIEITEMDDRDKSLINDFIQPKVEVMPDNNLLFILVESLETWAVHPTIMPHLCKLLDTYPTLHATKMKKQTVGGNSSDAQLIANTGILPINKGAVSHLYQQNLFPSIADCYDTLSLSIAPHGLDDCWNQREMNTTYHFDVAWSKSPEDSLLFASVKEAIDSGYRYTQVFTISSHAPFSAFAHKSQLQLPDKSKMPQFLADYIRSVNVADAGLAVLLSAIETDSILRNTTIVITGDHTIFSVEKRAHYDKVCKDYNLPYNVADGNYLPLIIYSPKIQENVRIDEICYQMDVYPTIMHLIGCEDYFWKGFGVNLLDSTARHNRPITEEQAYALSDKMIRADYFRTIVDSLNITIKDREPIFEP